MRITLFLLFLFPFLLQAQLDLSQLEFDLGTVVFEDDRFVDILITNKGNKKEFLLTVKKPREVVYLFDRKFMDPDSSMVLRLQVNPTKKGKFKYEVPFYLSDREEAVIAIIKGSIEELPRNNQAFLQNCPDFGSTPSEKLGYTFDFQVYIRDAVTNEPIKNAWVDIYGRGPQPERIKTNKYGVAEIQVTPGPYYITSNSDNYHEGETGDYYNFRRNKTLIYLQPLPEIEKSDKGQSEKMEKPHEEEVWIEIAVDTNTETEIEHNETDEIIAEVTHDDKEEDTFENTEDIPPLERISLTDFSHQYFDPVNVVFVLDVSYSMNKQGRIALLKTAMHEFVNVLRPQDQVTFVAFSSDANILMSPTRGNNKNALHSAVDGIEPKGGTSGNLGIKLGYRVCAENYIEGGNNQVIIITDGAFNRGDDAYKKVIEKEKSKRNIGIAIVGVQTSDVSSRVLAEVADLGQGMYVPITNISEAKENLILEVKRNAYKKR